MSELLYYLVSQMARIHDTIMTWNDAYEMYLTDKQLHFIVIGIIGMLMLLIIYPLFQALSEKHVLIIAWIYVFTVIVVLTFAIEIGQGISGTGSMEMEDIISGLKGFMLMFVIFAAIRMILIWLVRILKSVLGMDDEDE